MMNGVQFAVVCHVPIGFLLLFSHARVTACHEKQPFFYIIMKHVIPQVLCDGWLGLFERAGDGATEKTPEEASSAEKQEIPVSAHIRKLKRTMEELCPKRSWGNAAAI